MIGITTLTRRALNVFLALFIITAQLFVPLSVLVPKVSAAEVCEVDVQGADDEPGQKDLTKMCSDNTNATSGSITITWNWDDTAWSGNNSGDACALFDTDNDTFANYSLCAVVKNNPAEIIDTRVYSCSDAKKDRCTNPNQDTTITSNCTVSIGASQPFNTGTATPNDTTATCTIQLSDVGGVQSTGLIDVCSYPSQQPNSDPSDCIIATTKATVEVIKQIAPETDNGTFDLYIGSTKYVDDGGDNSTTGAKIIDDTKDVIVKEEAGLNSLLTNYTTTVSCINQDGITVASGTPTGTSSRQTTINAQNVNKGDSIVCTFTNTRQTASIQVVKDVINDNGGTKTYEDFTFQVNDEAAQTFIATTSPDGARTISVPVGTTYTITEPEANTGGYATTYTNCSNITPVVGQTQVCTITNNDTPPSLTLNKVLVNAFGGNAVESDWTLTATGPTSISGAGAAGVNDVVSGSNFSAGTYSLSESTGPSGYTASSWVCTNGVTVNQNSQITLANGQTTVCTITNSELAPTLTLIKNVMNNNGGRAEADDFAIRLNGTIQTIPTLSNNNLTATYNVSNPASNTTYTMSEDEFAGYDDGQGVSCVDNATGLSVGHPVTLNEGQSVTCTITNDDISPTLKLIKEVINNNGGTLVANTWTLYATPETNTVGATTESGAGGFGPTNVYANVQYTLTESGMNVDGYTASSWSCTNGTLIGNILTLALDQDAECTITNDDNAPSLTLVKTVTNDNGGDRTNEEWTLSATGSSFQPTNISGAGGATSGADFKADTYTLGETGPQDYEAGDWSCTNGVTVNANNQITLANGQATTCTINNDDIAPELTLVKNIIDSEDSEATAADFTPTINDTNTTWGTHTLNTGTYAVSELETDGWQLNGISCYVTGSPSTGVNNPVELSLGDKVTCIVTNEEMGSITVTKDAQPNDSQDFHFTITKEDMCDFAPVRSFEGCYELSSQNDTLQPMASSFDLDDDNDAELSNSKVVELAPGNWYTITEDQISGWDLTDIDCGDIEFVEVENGVSVYADTGQNIECTFTNVKRAKVTVTKFNDRNENGTQDAGEEALSGWEITLDTTKQKTSQDGTTTFTNILPGEEYIINETQQKGWEFSSISCTGIETAVTSRENPNAKVNPVAGETVSCKIGNYKPEPAVLGEQIETTEQLVDTGSSSSVTNMYIGLGLLSTGVAAVTIRRKKDEIA